MPANLKVNISDCPPDRPRAIRISGNPINTDDMLICLKNPPRFVADSCTILKSLNSSHPVHFIGFGRTLSQCAFHLASRGADVNIFEPHNPSALLLVENLERNKGILSVPFPFPTIFRFLVLKYDRFEKFRQALSLVCGCQERNWTAHVGCRARYSSHFPSQNGGFKLSDTYQS